MLNLYGATLCLRRLTISLDFLPCLLYVTPDHVRITEGIPRGTTVRECLVHPHTQSVILILEHPSYGPVAQGEAIPEERVLYTAVAPDPPPERSEAYLKGWQR